MSLVEAIELLESRPTTFSLTQLCEHASRGGVAAAVARGDITRVLPDRYASTLHADSWLVRSHAAAKWGPAGCALTGLGVLLDAGLRPREPEEVQLLVPHWRHRPSPAWLAITSSTYRPTLHVRADEARVVDPELALVHAYSRAREADRAELLYGLTRRGALSLTRVREHLDRLPRLRGRASLLRRLERAQAGVESFLEECGADDVLVGIEFSTVVRQHRLAVRGERYRVDAYDPVTRTAFEFDSKTYHGGNEQRVRDVRRDALLSTLGIATVRFDYSDVTTRPAWCRGVALEVLAARHVYA
ncbi:hypothetical protein [Demequina sp. NBRC 110053]|uniref:hypothetical protein n=1 Tax=Demequina sp. NBRC 110053 TaxID=1570342 RepID=UPI0011867BD5|nr:hypothetical protein [Demequina sp. NBRC 110053]